MSQLTNSKRPGSCVGYFEKILVNGLVRPMLHVEEHRAELQVSAIIMPDSGLAFRLLPFKMSSSIDLTCICEKHNVVFGERMQSGM